MTDLMHASALAVARAIRSKAVSPLEVLDASLARADAVDGQINALVWRNDEQARASAREAGEVLARRPVSDLPPFFGVPLPVKDLTPVAGWPVTYGSRGATAGAGEESALVVEALQRAGFVLCARTNTPEFGAITATENLRYGVTRNPWNLDRTAGGSSGGAAAAVAAGIFAIAHGNDGGGSIRIPASCCGLVGLKVSRGRVPHRSTPWEGGSVEGVLTRDVADTAAVLDLIGGPDPLCWYNAPAPDRPFAEELGAPTGALRIGVATSAPLGLEIEGGPMAALRRAVAALEALGHHPVEVATEIPVELMLAFTVVANAGLGHRDDVDWSLVEPHIRANRAAAQGVDSLTYIKAVQDLQAFSRTEVARWGRDFDILVTPTMTIEPPHAGAVLAAAHDNAGGVALPVLQMAALTSPFNVSGQPAISLPLGETEAGLPVGVQLVGGPFGEALLLRVAHQLEEALPWAGRHPSL